MDDRLHPILTTLPDPALPFRLHLGGTSAGVADRLVYAIGDVHGRYDLLKQLVERLTRDWAARAEGRRPLVIFCGDYIDRGPQSAEVVEALLWLMDHADIEVRALKGNHEQAMLDFIDRPEDGAAWLRFGGAETLVSYGVRPPASDTVEERTRARNELLQKMPASHLRLFEMLEPMVVVGDFAFVHAGVRPGVPLEAQTEQDLLWIRKDFFEAPGGFEKIIVHGHTWFDDRPQRTPSRLGLDTGAYATGVLTALRLDRDGGVFLQARAASAAEAA